LRSVRTAFPAHPVRDSRGKLGAVAVGGERGRCVADLIAQYSPDLNPIQQVFAKVKTQLRNAAARTVDAIAAAFGQLLNSLTPKERAKLPAKVRYAPNAEHFRRSAFSFAAHSWRRVRAAAAPSAPPATVDNRNRRCNRRSLLAAVSLCLKRTQAHEF